MQINLANSNYASIYYFVHTHKFHFAPLPKSRAEEKQTVYRFVMWQIQIQLHKLNSMNKRNSIYTRCYIYRIIHIMLT